jgi:hypothetical protein
MRRLALSAAAATAGAPVEDVTFPSHALGMTPCDSPQRLERARSTDSSDDDDAGVFGAL